MYIQLLERWLPALRCPSDRNELFLQKTTSTDGVLICEKCLHEFPFRDGILRFIDSNSAAISDSKEKAQEMRARDEYAHDYHKHFSKLLNEIEIPPYLRAIGANIQDQVIELGCGTGRVTKGVLREVSNLVALDFSLESLKVLRDSLSVKERAKCLLIQGDMTILPFADQVFTKAISFQVIEHLPGEKCRHDSMCEAARVLKPDGRFIGSAYHFSEIKKKRQSPQEGFHEQNGAPIYYFHFDEPALTHLLTGAGFKIRKMEGLVLYLRGMRFLGKVAILINRCLSPTQWGRRYSHLLFFVAENNTARRSG